MVWKDKLIETRSEEQRRELRRCTFDEKRETYFIRVKLEVLFILFFYFFVFKYLI